MTVPARDDVLAARATRYAGKADRYFRTAERYRDAGDDQAAEWYERSAIGYADAARNLRTIGTMLPAELREV